MESLNKGKFSFILILLLMMTVTHSFGQTWDEFFRQSATQKRYLLEQLAALKVYSGYLKQGYDIANKGLKTIKGITNGEFNLHSAFLNSLKTVSPVIKNDIRVAQIISFQLSIRKAWSNSIADGLLNPDHQVYVNDVKRIILNECENDLDELLLVLSPDRLEMKDNERIQRLDKVYQSMSEKSAFTQSFISKVSLLAHIKEREMKSVKHLIKYYGKD